MKVTKNTDEEVEFNNGLKLSSDHDQGCCEHNYLDFEQLHTGREFPDMTATQFIEAISIKPDGFSIKDSEGIPAWVQARSEQNGYYGDGVNLVVDDGNITLIPKRDGQDKWDELFEGKQ